MFLALVRMILFVAVTSKEVIALLFSRRFALRRAQRWGLLSSKILGLKIDAAGAFPSGPALFVANHRSYADIPALLSLGPSFFLAKKEVASWPLIGRAARNAGTVLVRRENRDSRLAAKEEIGHLVRSGHAVTVFCEGTTSRGPGALPFRPGLFHLAADQGLPIVPVAIQYESAEDAWVDEDTLLGHFFERFRRRATPVRIFIGPALRGDDGALLHDAAESWISDRLRFPTPERRPACATNPVTATSFSAALPAS